ncbi:MAG: TIGR04084 family radical SAM/SPASM domain-containing protein [Candidatus Aenigmarchaeota archaeon]|nr:TIGR04084 family radical SAM/SPASM domain-containing protein [Candidatus Aenigmarchaeota archaeon]
MFFHVIMTTECNGQCYYCYQKSLDDMEEDHGMEIDYDVPQTISYDLERLKAFISKDPYPTVTFYGGEPLMQTDKIKKIMDAIKARFMIQTNGILLHKLPKEYVNRFHTILVSIDGNRETTDKYRGKGNYDKVIRNLNLIRKNGFEGEIIARMTIEDQDIFGNVVHLLENIDFPFASVHWQLDANFWNDYEQRNFSEWTDGSYNPGISKLIEYWVDKMQRGRVIMLYPFVGIIYDILHGKNTFLRCGSGYTNFTVLTNGKIIPCPIMVGMKDFYLGDISSDPKSLRMDYKWKEPCCSCDIFGKCGGRCLYSNYLQPWGIKGTKEVCDTIRFLISELERKMPEIRELIEKGKISVKDFDHVKYNGAEIIP